MKKYEAHGLSKSDEYMVWRNMLKRCYNKKTKDYKYYGGRGIEVCERWRNSFIAFLGDIGPRPTCYFSIDRMNNNGNYEPGNVRWATQSEQNLNQQKSMNINRGIIQQKNVFILRISGIYLGSFKTIEEARMFRDSKILKMSQSNVSLK